jgi:hypothetical protein
MTLLSKAPLDPAARNTSQRKVMLLLIVTAAIVFLAAGVLMVLSPAGSRINLWFIFPGVCAMAACYLASGLLGALAQGKLAEGLRAGIQVLTLALLLGMLAIFFPNSPNGTLWFGLLMIVTGILAVAAYVARAYSDHYWLVARAAVVVMLGVTLEQGVSLTSISDVLRGVPLTVSVIVAAISLVGLMHEHSNHLLRLVGRFFRSGSNMVMVTVVLTLIFVYVLKLRGAIAQRAPDQTLLAEWIVLAIAIIVVVFKFFSYFRSKERQQDFCDTRRLVQSIYRDRGDTGYAQSVVDRFIVEGIREPMIVLLTTALVQGCASPYDMEMIIEGVVRYREAERRFTFRWALGDEMATIREERTRIAFDALDRTAKVLGAGYLVSDRGSQAVMGESNGYS